MTVLLIGGTGLLGGAIAAELELRGAPRRALVRTGRRAARLRERGFELYAGDLRDPRALRQALAGVRTVVTTAQGSPFSRRRSHARVDGEGNLRLIEAAAAAGVEHLVFVSALRSDEGARLVPQLGYKFAAEQALRTSGMRYTILRPSSFQETFGYGFAPFKRLIDGFGIGLTLGSGTGWHSWVAVRDVARAAVIALDRREALDAVIPIGGPDDLSYREAYARIARVTGRRVRVVSIPRVALWAVGALAAPLLPELRGFFALFAFFDRAGYSCVTPAWLLEALGQRRSFDEGIRSIYEMTSADSPI